MGYLVVFTALVALGIGFYEVYKALTRQQELHPNIKDEDFSGFIRVATWFGVGMLLGLAVI